MTVTIPEPAVAITVVRSPACHFCEDAVGALADLAAEYRIDLELIELDSAAGASLAREHRPALNPLVLVDGEYFSTGRLPRKKLARLLESLGARAEKPEPRDGF